jgi:chromosome segregation ATPase
MLASQKEAAKLLTTPLQATTTQAAAVLIGLLCAVGLVAQTKPTTGTPKSKATRTKTPPESAERTYILRQFALTLKECDELNIRLDASRKENQAIEWGSDVIKADYDELQRLVDAKTEELKQWRLRLLHVDDCMRAFRKTIDMKSADLTVRDTELIAGM